VKLTVERERWHAVEIEACGVNEDVAVLQNSDAGNQEAVSEAPAGAAPRDR
jgi:hypothetical protein